MGSPVQYVNIQKFWRKLGPIYRSPEARAIWLPHMLEYGANRTMDYFHKFNKLILNFFNGQDEIGSKIPWGTWGNITYPGDFDSCDWRLNYHECHRGPCPRFFEYVCYSACHYLVDLNLYVISTAYPELPWQIVTSDKHSTVWDGEELLMDANFLALEVDPDEAFEMARSGTDAEILEPFEFRGIFTKKLAVVERMVRKRGLI